MRALSILGCTGSIGARALDVAALHPNRFRIVALTAFENAQALFAQVRKFKPLMAGLAKAEVPIPDDLKFCEWVFGDECLRTAATLDAADDVLVSVVGIAGLTSVLSALSSGKRVLLANKEALVAGGSLVMAAAHEKECSLLPVDSEHSAIFQCLRAADGNKPEKLILTASGGPFRTWEKERIESATVRQALCHPNWSMGKKISVDSASMMNKALEVIEARWLFDIPGERIDVLVHPQSIIHSMVEFSDGAVLAQLGTPDMRLPILYAMSYPERLPTGGERLNLAAVGQLTLEPVDHSKFPALRLAYDALEAGGAACAILNAANEVAVEAFLKDRIAFGGIFRTVAETIQRVPSEAVRTLDDVLAQDAAARRMASSLIS